MSKCTPQNITYKANPELLAAGPAEGQDDPVPGLHQQQHGQRRPGQRERAVGAASTIPGIKAFYTAKSPDFKYWFPPTVNVTLIPNLTDPPASRT